MDKNAWLNLCIDKDWNIVIDVRAGNRIRHKVITPDMFCQLVAKNVKVKGVTSGILPEGCVAFSEKDGVRFVAVELGQDRIDLTYEKTTYENFPVPRLIYGFNIDQNGKITGISVAVADKGTLRDDTKLYKYPFSNVLGFSMCTGANTFPTIKHLSQLSGIPGYIFSMPDNNDRYSPENTKLVMEYRNLLEFLHDKAPDFYYTDVLIESDKTFSEFLSENGG